MVVKIAILHSVALYMILTGCGDQSYEECVLDRVGVQASENAVETIKESCRRKHEVRKAVPLEAYVRNELEPYSDGTRRWYLVITNKTSEIVTLADIKFPSGRTVQYDTWIEPDRWVEVEFSKEPELSGFDFKVGDKLEALSAKVIPNS
jgi:hypothetical protein